MSFLRSLRGGRLLVAAVITIGFLVGLSRLAATIYTELLWHGQAGYGGVFLKRVFWQWGARVGGGLAVGILVFVNLRIVSGTLGGIQIKRRFGNLEISEQLPRSYVLWTMAGASALLAMWFGAAVPASVGIQALMLTYGEAWGLVEPILGRDVGFYVFWFPVLASIATFALIVVFLLFTLATAGYAATGALSWGRTRIVAQDLPRLHLGVLLGSFFLLLAARLFLARYQLLLYGGSEVQGIFGFADAEARLPALQTLVVICTLAGGTMVWAAWRNRGGPLLAALLSTVLGGLIIGQFYPALVQRFQVEPNELERESPFIEHNLRFTRIGLGLEALGRRTLAVQTQESVDWQEAGEQFAGLPVWNRGTLLTTFDELEARYPYYDFSDVVIDRYPSADGPVPMAVSVREVDPGGIQDPNWQNLHLRELYVGGMGAVVSRASDRTPEGRPPMVVSGIPPVTASGDFASTFALTRPQVFFGSRPQLHAVINPGEGQFLDAQGAPGQVGVDFPPGIELRSPLRTLALAWRFRDANLLFASEIARDSRFVFRRRVQDRVRAVAPFLRYPEAPYPVVSEGRVVWIVEAFTGTRAFPLSTAHDLQFLRPVNYVRNSVKITVDAVTGQIDFYRVPVEDPLADAYQAAFPGLFKPLAEMPADLRGHIRYSRELLNLQAQALLQYHQQTAPAFHGQQDVWSLPYELAEGTSPVPYRPEYGIWSMPDEDERRFQLATVFVPAGRQNLTAMLVARMSDEGVPELVLYDVSAGDQVQGPRQIEALVEQDPQISQQFSLWRTGGSEVWTGHLHLVPVGGRILYMEPVFLAAEADAIPELRRYVVSDGRRVTMNETLQGAMAALAGRETGPPSAESDPADANLAIPTEAWPSAALEILDRAETRLREGDWQGYGEAMEELRRFLAGRGQGGG